MNRKQLIFLAGDVLAVLMANVLAVALRFDFDWSVFLVRRHRNLELLLLDLLITPIIFYVTGLYQGYWKYAGLNDLVRLIRAITLRTVVVLVVFYVLGFHGLSRAVVIINTVLLLMFAGAIRLAPRFRFEFQSARRRGRGRNTLIIGAGDTGESLLRELRKSPETEYNPVGFVDDDAEKIGVKIHGVPVLGAVAALESLIEGHAIREVIIAIPAASGEDVRQIFDSCRRAGARCKTVPTRGEIDRGAARISQIRPVGLEDLLGREVVNLDQLVLRQSLSGRRVLITGAAGSIGREMARQVATYEPQELVLLDRNENNLFYLEAELRKTFPVLPLRVTVGDVLDEARLEEVFQESLPEIVVHAAAYKHVPLMEQNPLEAITNNVIATRRLAQIATRSKVERFIYVSTDKAVRPSSIMGATKRLGERLVTSIGGGVTRFIAVRFGNVLGSDGSVIPTFRKQILAGGPLTVTHPEASRYFMTIPEAVQLVLMAGAMGKGGEIYLLRMGQPVRIVDLARNLIELSGLKPDQDIKIVFTGLRAGEKLHEELKNGSEEALPTSNEKIMILTGVVPLTRKEWTVMGALEEASAQRRGDSALALLNRLVPEYHSTGASQPAQQSTAHKVVDMNDKRWVDAPA